MSSMKRNLDERSKSRLEIAVKNTFNKKVREEHSSDESQEIYISDGDDGEVEKITNQKMSSQKSVINSAYNQRSQTMKNIAIDPGSNFTYLKTEIEELKYTKKELKQIYDPRGKIDYDDIWVNKD